MATGPNLRIGDAERDAAAASLREHYAQGRLTLEEFNERLDAVYKATTQSQLSLITRDLPHAAARSAPLPVSTIPGGGRERARQEYGPRGGRVRLGVFPLIIAALGTWLLLFELHLRAFPWPGKLAIFLAILTAIRGVLRRVFGLGRGRVRVGRRGGPGRGPGGRRGRYSGGSWGGL
jgi:Domain of unknown function (DUF1707)